MGIHQEQAEAQRRAAPVPQAVAQLRAAVQLPGAPQAQEVTTATLIRSLKAATDMPLDSGTAANLIADGLATYPVVSEP